MCREDSRILGYGSREGICFRPAYDKLIQLAFHFPKITVMIAIGAVAIGCLVFVLLPQRMMPSTERNQFVVEIYLPTGAPFAKTEMVCDSVANILRRDKRITNVTSFVGTSAPRFHMCYAPKFPSKQLAQLIVTTTSEEMTNNLLDEYEDKYINYFPDAREAQDFGSPSAGDV